MWLSVLNDCYIMTPITLCPFVKIWFVLFRISWREILMRNMPRQKYQRAKYLVFQIHLIANMYNRGGSLFHFLRKSVKINTTPHLVFHIRIKILSGWWLTESAKMKCLSQWQYSTKDQKKIRFSSNHILCFLIYSVPNTNKNEIRIYSEFLKTDTYPITVIRS